MMRNMMEWIFASAWRYVGVLMMVWVTGMALHDLILAVASAIHQFDRLYVRIIVGDAAERKALEEDMKRMGMPTGEWIRVPRLTTEEEHE